MEKYRVLIVGSVNKSLKSLKNNESTVGHEWDLRAEKDNGWSNGMDGGDIIILATKQAHF